MQYKNALVLLGLTALAAVQAQEFDGNDVPQQCRSICQAMVDAARTCDQTNDGDRQEVDCICNTEGASTQLPECAACIRQFDTDDDDGDDDNDNGMSRTQGGVLRLLCSHLIADVDDVVRSCGFSSTTFNAASASSTGSGSITSSASGSLITSTFVTTSTDIDDDDDDDDDDETRTLTRTTVFPANATPTDASGSASNAGQSATGGAGSAASSATGGAGNAVSSATDGAGSAANSATNAAGSAAGGDSSGAAATALPILGVGAGALLAVVGLL